MAKQQKSPEVRFAGFTEDWEEKELGDEQVSSFVVEKLKSDDLNLDNYISTDNMLPNYLGVTSALKIPKNNNLTKFIEGDVLLSNIRPYLKKVWLANKEGGASNDVIVFRSGVGVTHKFLESIIKNDSFINYVMKSVKGVKMPRGDKESMLNYPLFLPNLSEQKKLGEYFKYVDDLNKNHQTQLTKLKNLKKAMLTKMFPQNGASVPEIRFKGFDEKWESFQLGNIGNTFTGLSGKTKEDFGKGHARYIPYTNIFNNEITNKNQLEKVEIDDTQNSVKYGDILFTTSSETPEEVGMSSVWMENDENVYLNSFCFGYRFKNKVDSHYMAYYMRSQYFRENMKILAQGISRFNISKTKVMEIDILLPDDNEQFSIGQYFTNLDKLISGHKEQLKKLNNIKKACLSKLFVT